MGDGDFSGEGVVLMGSGMEESCSSEKERSLTDGFLESSSMGS